MPTRFYRVMREWLPWGDRSHAVSFNYSYHTRVRASHVARVGRMCLPMWEISEREVQSLGQKDLPEEGVATCPCVLTWRFPWTEEPGGL